MLEPKHQSICFGDIYKAMSGNTTIVHLDEFMAERYKEFFSVYRHQKSIFTDIERETYLGENLRICRFCGKRFPEVTFNRKAHVVPQAIGNANLLCYFECDNCNQFFGKYEDHLAKFLSVLRPFVNVENSNRGGRRVGHNEPKSGLNIKSGSDGLELYSEAGKPNQVRFEQGNTKLVIDATIPPYSPLFVFKALLKIAVSMLDESEIDQFKLTQSFLLDNSQNYKVKGYGLFSCFVINVNGPPIWEKPFAVLHTKLDSAKESLYPQKVFTIFFASRVYQIFIPFGRNDDFLIGQKFRLIICPLPVDKSHFEVYGPYGTSRLDLSSQDLVKGQMQTLTLSVEGVEFYDSKARGGPPMYTHQ